jgi:hypothetical protein
MITPAATKRPRSIEELAAVSGLPANLVRGTLLHLGNEGLVRPLDREQNTWEISHDFLARILNNILAGWRVTLIQAVRPWALPASLAVWALAVLALLQWGRTHHVDRVRQAILAKGYQISATGPGFDFVDACGFDGDEKLFDYLKQLPSVKGLRLCIYSTEGMGGLADNADVATVLQAQFHSARSAMETQHLPVEHQISEVTVRTEETNLWGLVTREQKLHVFSQALGERYLARIGELTQLETLEVKGSALRDLLFLAPLSRLHTLTLAYTRVEDLTELTRHPLFSELNMVGGGEDQAEAVRDLGSKRPEIRISADGRRYLGGSTVSFRQSCVIAKLYFRRVSDSS